MLWNFSDPDLPSALDTADEATIDLAPFGVIGMTPDGLVASYSLTESRLTGLTPSKVIGRLFFAEVAPCMNNYLVSHRFETEPEIDAVIDYVFTLRLRPTPVRLRLLKSASRPRMYLLVEPR